MFDWMSLISLSNSFSESRTEIFDHDLRKKERENARVNGVWKCRKWKKVKMEGKDWK